MTVGVPIGTVLGGDYKIVRKLGEGGMGAVYVAEQLSTGSQRALKLMQAGLLADAEMRRRFEQEARVGAKIRSDHVVQVIAAGVDAATSLPYLAMELLEGHTLADALDKGPLPPHEVREVMGQLLHAMAAAHAEGVVHRDLKPENVYLAYSRREGARYTVKVLDFGIAKVVAEAKPSATKAIGTPLWMAPEQSKTGEQVVPATDVWALGLIAFRMLTGRYFWKGAYDPKAETWTVMREVLVDELPSATARAQEYGVAHLLPPGFDLWFGRAVAREAAWRFPNAAEARAALLPILDAVSGAGSAAYAAPRASYVAAQPYAAQPYAAPSHPTPQNAHGQTPQTPPRAPQAPAQQAQFTPAGLGVTPRPLKKPSTVAPWLVGCGTVVVLGGLGIAAFFGLAFYLAGNQGSCASGDLDSCETACFGMGSDGPSCAHLGDAHVKDWGSATRAADAARAYEKGCEIGHAPSCRHVIALDGAKAVAALDKACSGEHSEVCGLLAEALADAPRVAHDEARAVQVAKPACDKGDADACAALGRLALRGADGPPDPKRAADLAMQACHLEQPSACVEAGVAKLAGHGTALDAEGAKALFLKAEHTLDLRCTEGEGDACWSLGRMYGLGIGVSADMDRAAHAFVRGCDAGEARACMAAGLAAEDGAGPSAHDDAKARTWLDHACAGGATGACLKLAARCDDEIKPGALLGPGACAAKWDAARKAAAAGCDARVAPDCSALARAALAKKAPGVDAIATLEKACELGDGPACSSVVDEAKHTLDAARAKKALGRGCDLGDGDACAGLAEVLQDAKDPSAGTVRAVACARGADAACAAK